MRVGSARSPVSRPASSSGCTPSSAATHLSFGPRSPRAPARVVTRSARRSFGSSARGLPMATGSSGRRATRLRAGAPPLRGGGPTHFRQSAGPSPTPEGRGTHSRATGSCSICGKPTAHNSSPAACGLNESSVPASVRSATRDSGAIAGTGRARTQRPVRRACLLGRKRLLAAWEPGAAGRNAKTDKDSSSPARPPGHRMGIGDVSLT